MADNEDDIELRIAKLRTRYAMLAEDPDHALAASASEVTIAFEVWLHNAALNNPEVTVDEVLSVVLSVVTTIIGRVVDPVCGEDVAKREAVLMALLDGIYEVLVQPPSTRQFQHGVEVRFGDNIN